MYPRTKYPVGRERERGGRGGRERKAVGGRRQPQNDLHRVEYARPLHGPGSRGVSSFVKRDKLPDAVLIWPGYHKVWSWQRLATMLRMMCRVLYKTEGGRELNQSAGNKQETLAPSFCARPRTRISKWTRSLRRTCCRFNLPRFVYHYFPFVAEKKKILV